MPTLTPHPPPPPPPLTASTAITSFSQRSSAPCTSVCVAAASASELGANTSWRRPQPKSGRLTRSPGLVRSEEHTSELQSLMRISYAVFCLKHKKLRQMTRRTSHMKVSYIQTVCQSNRHQPTVE